MGSLAEFLRSLALASCVFPLFPDHGWGEASTPETTRNVRMDYQIARNGDSYTVESKYLEKRRYIVPVAQPHPWDTTILLTEYAFCKLKSLSVRYNGKGLDKSRRRTLNWTGGDTFLSDTVLHEFYVSDSFEAQDEVVIEYRKGFQGIQFLPVVQVPNVGYLEMFRVRFLHPRSLRIDLEPFFSRQDIPYTILRDRPGMTELVVADLAPFERLAFFPFNDIHAAFLVSISDARGVVDLSTPQALQAWYLDHLDLDPSLPDSLMRLLNGGFSPEDDDRHKLEVIYDFVRSEIRYLADSRGSFAYLPHNPAYTLERRYGDCKDRAYALYSIARAFGIDVEMALVATQPQPRFRGTNLGTFDHMICAYEDSGTVHYFDPTCRYCEFGNLPSHEIGAQVLRLTESATWPATISLPPRRPSLQVSIKGSIDSSVARADITLRNDEAFVMREAKATLPAVEFENIASSVINGNFNALTLSRFEWLDDRDECVLLQARADLSTFRIETEAKIYLPKTPFRVLGSDVLERAGDEALVHLDSPPISIVLDLDLALGDHTIQPDELLLGQQGSLWLSAKAHADGARLRLDYRMIQSDTIFGVETKQQLMTFLEQIAKSRPAMFTITKRQS